MTNSVLYKNITRKETMKKLLLILAILWVGLNAFAKSVQADDYNTAVVAHVIKENISGNGVDMSVLESEMQKIAYQFALETATTADDSDAGAGNLLLENQGTDTSKNYFINEEYNVQTQSKYADNNDLDTEAGFDTASTADDILDFAESNPFGEPGDF